MTNSALLDYREAGVTIPEEGIIQFIVTQEHIDEIKKHHVRYNYDTVGSGTAEVTCSPSAAIALQIFLMTGKFKASTFRASLYSQDWKEYKPKVKKSKDVTDDEETT